MNQMVEEKNTKINSRDFQQEILVCITKNIFGVTVQDIADQIRASRNTISKYIFQLELEKKVIKKKVGTYFLYFIPERDFVQRKIVNDFYKGVLFSLKRNFPNQESIFKKIGRDIGDYYKIPLDYIRGLTKESYSVKDVPIKAFLEIFGEFYPYFDVFQSICDISIIGIDSQGNKATYRFNHSNLLEDTDEFIYHFYIISGIIETTFSRELHRRVLCDVVKINISEIKANSFLDISIEIKE